MDSPEERAKRFDLHAEVEPDTAWGKLNGTQREILSGFGVFHDANLDKLIGAGRLAASLVEKDDLDMSPETREQFVQLTAALTSFIHETGLDDIDNMLAEGDHHVRFEDGIPAHIGPIGIGLDDIGSEGR